jgi:hypothetical protein
VTKKALQVAETNAGHNYQNVIVSLTNLALVYKFQNQYEQAELLYKLALEIETKALGSNNPQVIPLCDAVIVS